MANTPVLPVQGAQGSVPGQGTRSHMLQLKIPHAAMKTQCNQINILNGKKKKNSSQCFAHNRCLRFIGWIYRMKILGLGELTQNVQTTYTLFHPSQHCINAECLTSLWRCLSIIF